MVQIARIAARRLRNNATEEERILWSHLRQRRLEGVRFRRQHPMGPFVVDFVDLEHRLVIEIDGVQHVEDPRVAARDRWRTEWLERAGYRVARFGNGEVRCHLHEVIDTIWGLIEEQRTAGKLRRRGRAAPPPRPSPFEGEGEKPDQAGERDRSTNPTAEPANETD